MRDEDALTGAERELAAALGGLQPAAAGLDRSRLMFDAGRAAGRRGRRLWQGVSGALAAGLLALLALRPGAGVPTAPEALPGETQMALATTRPQSPLPPIRPEAGRYALLRDRVLARGLEALPAAGERWTGARPPTLHELIGGGGAVERPQRGGLWKLLPRRDEQ